MNLAEILEPMLKKDLESGLIDQETYDRLLAELVEQDA